MMIAFWLIAAALTSGAVVLLLRPLVLAKRGDRAIAPEATQGDAALNVYRDQLAEIDRDRDRGVMSAAEADNARREIKRRLLAADRRRTVSAPAGRRPPGWAQWAVMAAVPALALGIYLSLGSPFLPAEPYAGRVDIQTEAVNEARQRIAALSRRVRENPDDLRGWLALAEAHAQLGQYRAAIQPLERAVAMGDRAPRLVYGLAEMVIRANDGIVGQRALDLLQEVLEKQPGNPRARYFMALAQEQQGRFQAALGAQQQIFRDLAPNDPIRRAVRGRILSLAERAGVDPAEALPQDAAPGPERSAAARAEDMSPEQREAMINNMVEGLAGRLAENPDNPDGWLRLARSYQVLGRRQDFIGAAEKAVELAPDNPEALLYGGIAARLDDRPREALSRLKALQATLSEDAPGYDDLSADIEALRQEVN